MGHSGHLNCTGGYTSNTLGAPSYDLRWYAVLHDAKPRKLAIVRWGAKF